MDPKFNDIANSVENQIFKVVFFPDRIYHARYLNATRSTRYRYNVMEVRGKHDFIVMKGEVYLDGKFLTTFLRIEYRASRLVEASRSEGRLMSNQVIGLISLYPSNSSEKGYKLSPVKDVSVKLRYDRWIEAYQVEIWRTLEPPGNSNHDYKVLDMMGKDGEIVRIPLFDAALEDILRIKEMTLSFRENDINHPLGYPIKEAQWDNNFLRSYQKPRRSDPSSNENTVETWNYFITFQRGWLLRSQDITPVRYRNAMMDGKNSEQRDDNILEMRWIFQRELGSNLVYFHEVEIPAGVVEGTHRHIGSEELYYIVAGKGTAYMGDDDDPNLNQYPIVKRDVFGLGKKECREVPVEAGDVILTKSGGIHGIKGADDSSIRFVAFGYQTS